MKRQAEVQDIIDATDAWNMDSKLERAMAALRCPAGDLPVTHLFWWRTTQSGSMSPIITKT